MELHWSIADALFQSFNRDSLLSGATEKHKKHKKKPLCTSKESVVKSESVQWMKLTDREEERPSCVELCVKKEMILHVRRDFAGTNMTLPWGS